MVPIYQTTWHQILQEGNLVSCHDNPIPHFPQISFSDFYYVSRNCIIFMEGIVCNDSAEATCSIYKNNRSAITISFT